MSKELQKKLDEFNAKAQEKQDAIHKKEISYRAIAVDEENKTATFVMSTESIDRHGDIVDQESWNLEHFKKNPMFFFQHRSDQFPLGKWLDVWFEDDPDNEGKQRLVGEAKFRTKFEDADRAFEHVKEGDMSAVSVGFIPHRVDYDEDKDAFILYDCELLECSLVGIGSNRDALITSDKDAKNDEEDVEKESEEPTVKEKAIEVQQALQKEILDQENRKVYKKHKAQKLISQAIRNL